MSSSINLPEDEYYRAWGNWALGVIQSKQCPRCLTEGSIKYQAGYSCGSELRCSSALGGCGEPWLTWMGDVPKTELDKIIRAGAALGVGIDVVRRRADYLRDKGRLLPAVR